MTRLPAARIKWISLAVLAVVAVGAAAYLFGLHRGAQAPDAMTMTTTGASKAQTPALPDPPDAEAGARQRVLYWHDPMVPGHRFDKPGKSPFMDMDLVPVYADEAGEDDGVRISPRVQQSLGIRTAEVTRGTLAAALQVTGSVTYNERDLAVVTARNSGYVEKLFVRTTLQPVRQGQPLAQLYIPEWVAAQEEYLSARRLDAARFEGLVEAARQRMALTGMPETVIRKVETTLTVQAHFTVTAPIAGVVTELAVREGATLGMGVPLFRINGLRTVWVNAEIPESAARQVRAGMPAQARSAAFPDQAFAGEVSALLPEVNPVTRTLKARLEVRNPGARLAPGMFVTVEFPASDATEYLVVPSEALIRTGARDVVFVAEGEGRFTPVEVEAGAESAGQTEVRKGLRAGQRVVVSGQFLVDSEASLRGAQARMESGDSAQGPASMSAAQPEVHAESPMATQADAPKQSHGVAHPGTNP